MFDPSKAIKKMLGPGINVPSYRQGKSMRDSDGDGINDIMDCQPKNMFRQDGKNVNIKWEEPLTIVSGKTHNDILGHVSNFGRIKNFI